MTTTGEEIQSPPLVPMTGRELRALAEIEIYWLKHGKFPSKILTEGFDLSQSMQKESFMRGLFNRGIRPPDNPNNMDLSNEQMTAILLVADHTDRRSLPAKLKSLGLKSQTWQGWMQDKRFKEFLHHLSSKNFEDALHVAHQGLLASVERGDVNAIKYWHELTGRAVSPEVQNVRVLLSRLIQVIQTHIKDEATLMAIGKDFERVMRGDAPQPQMILPSI